MKMVDSILLLSIHMIGSTKYPGKVIVDGPNFDCEGGFKVISTDDVSYFLKNHMSCISSYVVLFRKKELLKLKHQIRVNIGFVQLLMHLECFCIKPNLLIALIFLQKENLVCLEAMTRL